ncbi:cytochrome P450 [Boletus coccyginus]|nr:cytochrome P450 [Boletus coccyginus]
MTEEYGPVFTLRQGTRIFIIIGRHRAALEIMEKQGASLADRPRSIAAAETLSGGMRVVVEGTGDRLRRLRRALHALLQSKVAVTYEPVQVQHAKNVLLDILEDPGNHRMHAKRYAASVIMSITYGKTTPTAYSDPEVVAVNRCLARFGQAMRPGAYLVDTYPILKYVPGYLTQLKKWHEEELALFQGQLNLVREQMERGDAKPCFSKFLLENQREYGVADAEIAYVAGSMFGAGSDTTASAITIMMMAAALHPEAQTKVQEELDNVVGRERLPSFSDQEMLPQVTAFMLESLRWRPVSIGGFAHCATSDLIWNNYLIPKGATVIGNHWAIANDPEVFPNPEKFDPQRWFTPEGHLRDDLHFCTFGFGRRICPGMHVANRSVFINTAFVLWAFRVSEKPTAPIDSFAFSDTVNMHAMPFELIFEDRLPRAEIRKLCTESLDGE